MGERDSLDCYDAALLYMSLLRALGDDGAHRLYCSCRMGYPYPVCMTLQDIDAGKGKGQLVLTGDSSLFLYGINPETGRKSNKGNAWNRITDFVRHNKLRQRSLAGAYLTDSKAIDELVQKDRTHPFICMWGIGSGCSTRIINKIGPSLTKYIQDVSGNDASSCRPCAGIMIYSMNEAFLPAADKHGWTEKFINQSIWDSQTKGKYQGHVRMDKRKI